MTQMTLTERSEILASLHRLKVDTAALYVKCHGVGLLSTGVVLEKSRDELGELIDDIQGKPELMTYRGASGDVLPPRLNLHRA